jgi:hypothetical protein
VRDHISEIMDPEGYVVPTSVNEEIGLLMKAYKG